MASLKQIEANRRNALKSTGPRTAEGKMRSRRNAVRHGLTAETVVVGLEDSEDYRAFEASVTADYEPQTAVERELVLRLASLLWRLRRATAIETGLLMLGGESLNEAVGNESCLPRIFKWTRQWLQPLRSHSRAARPRAGHCSALLALSQE